MTTLVNAVPPLLVAVLGAYFVTVFTKKRSILTEKAARKGVHVAREYGVDVLEQVPVARMMHRDFETVGIDMTIDALLRKYAAAADLHSAHQFEEGLWEQIVHKIVPSLMICGLEGLLFKSDGEMEEHEKRH